MASFIVFIKELPQPVKFSTILYVVSILSYNGICSYLNAKLYLENYRANRLERNLKDLIKSDWDAVKYGANVDCYKRLWDSIIWPITITNNIIPWIVLNLNKKKNE